jgi:hypothetical protein
MEPNRVSSSQEDIAEIIQIDDPEIDVQAVMARIREAVEAHALDEKIEFPTFAVAKAQRGDDPRFSQELYYQLEQANLNYDQIWVELSLVEERMPIVGPFVNRFKRDLHRLVLFYVNALGERQITMNDALLKTINQLVESLEMQPAPVVAEIQMLRDEVARLEQRVEQLESEPGRDG